MVDQAAFYANQQLYNKNLELLRAKEKLTAILSGTREMVLIFDENLRLDLASRSSAMLMNANRAPLEQNPSCDELLVLFDEGGSPLKLSDFLKAGMIDRFVGRRFNLRTVRGDLSVEISVLLLEPSGSGKEFVVLVRDVSAEKEISRLKEELLEIISHRLRTPLTSIKGYLWMLSSNKGGLLSKESEQFVGKAVRATEVLSLLVSRILDAAVIEENKVELKVEPLDVAEVVSGVAEKKRGEFLGGPVSLEVSPVPEGLSVYGDKVRVQEVLSDLLSNALKFTKEGKVVVAVREEKGFVKFEVTDSGVGFRPEDKERLFRKFGRLNGSFTDAAEASGTGLGLYISKMLVEKMSGAVGAESAGVGKGSIFWFSLPVVGVWGK